MNGVAAFITATPPSPDGDLHVGHIAGPYVAADVYRRYILAAGGKAIMATGHDDHRSHVQVRGIRDGTSPEHVAGHYADRIEETWRDVGVTFDISLRPRRETGYAEFVRGFFRRLYEKGDIVLRARPLPYCNECARWLYEAFVSGRCPHCKVASGGNACEACGRPNHCGDLINPSCAICGTPAELRSCPRLFFRLERYEKRLRAYWRRVNMPPHLQILCEQMRRDGLPEIAVSHPADWGVPVPVDDLSGQRIHSRFETAPGYLLQARQALGDEEALARSDDDAFVQLFGFDDGYFHAVLFPALFMAYDERIRPPGHFVVNESYQMEGERFPTGGRPAIWARDLLADCDPDVLRFHVLSDRPNGRRTSFSKADLKATRAYLRESWDGWIERLTADLERHARGRVPEVRLAEPDWRVLESRLRLQTRLRTTLRSLHDAYSVGGFDMRRVTALLDELVKMGTDFGHVQGHYAEMSVGDPRFLMGLVGQLVVAQALAAWASPVMPGACERLAKLIGYDRPLTLDEAPLEEPPSGRQIGRLKGAVFGA